MTPFIHFKVISAVTSMMMIIMAPIDAYLVDAQYAILKDAVPWVPAPWIMLGSDLQRPFMVYGPIGRGLMMVTDNQ